MNTYSDVASKTLLFYIQEWGQTLQERIDALNAAVRAANIQATFIQEVGFVGWKSDDPDEAERANRFRAEIDSCWPKGDFHEEARAIERVIQKYFREAREEEEE